MDGLDSAIRLLESAPRVFFCVRCLRRGARAISHRPGDAERVAPRQHYRRGVERCDRCTRVTLALGSVPPVKCARCSWPISENDAFVMNHDDLFHHHCWCVLESHARTADSKQIAQLRGALIERTIELLEPARE